MSDRRKQMEEELRNCLKAGNVEAAVVLVQRLKEEGSAVKLTHLPSNKTPPR